MEKKAKTSGIIGKFEACDANGIRGWVADRNNFDTKLEVEINIDNMMFYAKADLFMEALVAAKMGDGKFAFNLPLPNTMFDGLEHTIIVKELTTSTILNGSPKKFIGKISEQPVVEDKVSEQPVVEDKISEQPVVEDKISEQPVVEDKISEQPVVEDKISKQPVVEDKISEQPVVEDKISEQPVVEDKISEQPVVKDEISEQPVVKKTEEIEKKSYVSIIGKFETCDASGIRGWVADRNNFNSRLDIEINIDDIMFYKVKANLFMEALLTAKIGDGKFAFNIPLPNSMFDGLEHTITIKELTTSTVLRGSPKKFIGKIFEHPTLKDKALADKLKNIDLVITKLASIERNKAFIPPPTLKFGYLKTESPSGEYGALRQLGYSMFGSFIAPFVTDISKILIHNDKPILFLMREGYHLYDLFDKHFLRMECLTQRPLLKKLIVSRSFLFKLLLDDLSNLPLALNHSFKGSFLSLLTHRFALTKEDLAKVNPEYFNWQVNCPKDKDLWVSIVNKTCTPIFSDIAKKRDLYRNYLFKVINNQRDVFCIDLGFSGTIQRLLTILFDIKTYGYYLMLSNWSDYPKIENCEAEGFWGEIKRGTGDALVDYSLITEGMLTAPHGQLMDVWQQHEEMKFTYGVETAAQRKFHYTYPLIQGIDDYVNNMYTNNLSKSAIESLIDIRKNYWLHLCCDQSSEMNLLKQLVEVDDYISGFGVINPFQALGGLKL